MIRKIRLFTPGPTPLLPAAQAVVQVQLGHGRVVHWVGRRIGVATSRAPMLPANSRTSAGRLAGQGQRVGCRAL